MTAERVRDAEATKGRILSAAFEEFVAYGISGARVDRIAQAAKCNKNLIYIYFGSKEGLFGTVMEQQLSVVYAKLSLIPTDLPTYAGEVFDFAMSNPGLMRLLAWFNLEGSSIPSSARVSAQNEKVALIERAQRAGEVSGAFPAHFVLTAVMALATAECAANPFRAPHSTEVPADTSQARMLVEAAVKLIAGTVGSPPCGATQR